MTVFLFCHVFALQLKQKIMHLGSKTGFQFGILQFFRFIPAAADADAAFNIIIVTVAASISFDEKSNQRIALITTASERAKATSIGELGELQLDSPLCNFCVEEKKFIFVFVVINNCKIEQCGIIIFNDKYDLKQTKLRPPNVICVEHEFSLSLALSLISMPRSAMTWSMRLGCNRSSDSS